jgi:hypothetical protein
MAGKRESLHNIKGMWGVGDHNTCALVHTGCLILGRCPWLSWSLNSAHLRLKSLTSKLRNLFSFIWAVLLGSVGQHSHWRLVSLQGPLAETTQPKLMMPFPKFNLLFQSSTVISLCVYLILSDTEGNSDHFFYLLMLSTYWECSQLMSA